MILSYMADTIVSNHLLQKSLSIRTKEIEYITKFLMIYPTKNLRQC